MIRRVCVVPVATTTMTAIVSATAGVMLRQQVRRHFSALRDENTTSSTTLKTPCERTASELDALYRACTESNVDFSPFFLQAKSQRFDAMHHRRVRDLVKRFEIQEDDDHLRCASCGCTVQSHEGGTEFSTAPAAAAVCDVEHLPIHELQISNDNNNKNQVMKIEEEENESKDLVTVENDEEKKKKRGFGFAPFGGRSKSKKEDETTKSSSTSSSSSPPYVASSSASSAATEATTKVVKAPVKLVKRSGLWYYAGEFGMMMAGSSMCLLLCGFGVAASGTVLFGGFCVVYCCIYCVFFVAQQVYEWFRSAATDGGSAQDCKKLEAADDKSKRFLCSFKSSLADCHGEERPFAVDKKRAVEDQTAIVARAAVKSSIAIFSMN